MRNIFTLVSLLIFAFHSDTYAQSEMLYADASHVSYETKFDITRSESQNAETTLKAFFVICDNYASPENNGIAQSVRVDLGTMTQLLTLLEKRKIVNVEKHVLQGSKATLTNIINSLNAVTSGPNDIFMFYFSGHGGMQNQKTFFVTADEKDLLRSDVENILRSKPSKLKMLISDACSNDVDGLSGTRSLSRSGQQIDEGLYDKIYRDLFLGYQGMMNISASSEGEYAWSNDNFGGFFTYHFVKEGLIKKPINDWQTIFSTAKDKTSQMFMRMPAEEKARLAKEGVKNQTAKAYNMPVSITTSAPNTSTQTNTQTTTSPSQNVASIYIENFTGQNITFYQDNNNLNQAWTPSKLKYITVAPNQKSEIKNAYAIVGFESNGQDLYYELESGSYFFGADDYGVLDLYLKEEGANYENYHSYITSDFSQFLLGRWEWDDDETGELVTTEFFDDGSYEDYYEDQDESIPGEWFTSNVVLNEEHYSVVSFTSHDEDEDVSYILEYIIMYDEIFPDEVTLVFLAAYEDGELIPYEEAEEYITPSLTLYRVE